MSGTAIEAGSTVTWGRSTYTVVRHGCATDWQDCPRDHAVTIVRVDRTQTECAELSDLTNENTP